MRFFSRTGDKIAFWALIGLIILTLILSAVRQFAGLALVNGGLYVYLPLLTLLLAVGWGMTGIFRRLAKPVVRGVAGVVMVVVMLGLITVGMTYGGVAAGLSFPTKYVTVTSPNGLHRLLVMRGLDTDEERINARHAARLAADPEGDPGVTAEDWGYVYTAYAPGLLDLFYKADSLIDGEVHIGYASKAELMVEWEDDETVGHFYIKDPETGDDGDMRAAAR